MEEAYNKISDLLVDCTNDELLKLYAKISILKKDVKTSPIEISMEQLYNSLTAQMGIKVGTKSPPYYVVKRNVQIKTKLKETVAYLENFSKKISDVSIFEAELYNVFSRMLVDAYSDKPLLYILNCYAQFDRLLDKAFPGYYEAGLLHLVFNKNTF